MALPDPVIRLRPPVLNPDNMSQSRCRAVGDMDRQKLVVGMDYGTTYTGVAWSGCASDDLWQGVGHQFWPEEPKLATAELPSPWGYEVYSLEKAKSEAASRDLAGSLPEFRAEFEEMISSITDSVLANLRASDAARVVRAPPILLAHAGGGTTDVKSYCRKRFECRLDDDIYGREKRTFSRMPDLLRHMAQHLIESDGPYNNTASSRVSSCGYSYETAWAGISKRQDIWRDRERRRWMQEDLEPDRRRERISRGLAAADYSGGGRSRSRSRDRTPRSPPPQDRVKVLNGKPRQVEKDQDMEHVPKQFGLESQRLRHCALESLSRLDSLYQDGIGLDPGFRNSPIALPSHVC